MTNAEKYKDEIFAQICESGDWAINKNTGKITGCRGLSCRECLFDAGLCNETMIKWLNSEYREPKEFTDDERKFIELLDMAEWVARDNNDLLWAFLDKPRKKYKDRWMSSGQLLCLSTITSLPFSAIKSTDTKPTSRAKILGEK